MLSAMPDQHLAPARRPRGSGTIQRNGQLYRGQKTVNGKKLSTPWLTSETAVEKALLTLGVKTAAPAKPTLRSCVLSALATKPLKPSTRFEYERIFETYFDKVADRPIADLTFEGVSLLLQGMPTSLRTRQQARTVLIAAFKYAMQKGYVFTNHAKMASAGTGESVQHIEALDIAEALSLLDALSTRDKQDLEPLASYYTVALRYGLRPNERRSLCWEHIDLDSERATIYVESKLVHVRGKGLHWLRETKSAASQRRIPIDIYTKELLLRHRERTHGLEPWIDQNGKPRDLVWRQASGEPITMSFERRDWLRVQSLVNIKKPVPPYGTRHTAATMLIESTSNGGMGLDVLTVSRILGHSDIKLVESTYAKRSPGTYIAAAEAIERAMAAQEVKMDWESGYDTPAR